MLFRSYSCQTNEEIFIQENILGFPGGTVVENPPANAGDTGSSPGLGRSHIAMEQLSRFATTTEPAL